MKPLPILIPAMLLLAACTPTASDAASSPITGTPATGLGETKPASTPSTAASAGSQAESAPKPSTNAPVTHPTHASASISGAIRDGNRSPPALRVCATPVDGGAPTCTDTREGARDYRIDVAPGRYYLLGWVQSGDLTLIAHASQIRCIRAPCPPDALIPVAVSAGEQREGIDLSGGYAEVPEDWPKRPA